MSKNLSKEEEQMNDNSSTPSSHFLRRKRKEENSLAIYSQIEKSHPTWCTSEVKSNFGNESFKDGREIKEFEYDKLLKKTYNDEKITHFFKSKKNSLRGSPNFSSPGGAGGSNQLDENSEKINPQIFGQYNNINNSANKNNLFDSPIKGLSKVKNNPSTLNISPLMKNTTPPSNKKKRQEKDIKDYFKQFKLSSRTLLTLHKGNFISDVKNNEEIIRNKNMNPITRSSPQNLSKIVKNLPVQSPKTNEKNLKEIDKILTSISMKERFEELLNRELILPSIYKILLLQFKTLDRLILYLKFDKKIQSSLDSINSVLTSKKNKLNLDDSPLRSKELLKMPISQDDFSKMLTIAPYIFLYSLLKGKLIVDIPNDTERRIKIELVDYSSYTVSDFHKMQNLEVHKGLESNLSDDNLNQRSNLFKDLLIKLTKKQHDRYLKKKGLKFDAVKWGTWHSDFNLENVEKIKSFNLIPRKVLIC